MEWKQLRPGTIARCECGGETFLRVPDDTITWWVRRPAGLRRAPAGANEYRCKEKHCGKEYLGIGVRRDEAARFQAPALVLT